VPTGCQDYYPALYGGVSAIHLTMEGIQREALPVPQEMIDSQFLLVYTGMPRHSGINNWEVFKSHIAGDKKVVKNFAHISALSSAMHKAFLKLDWDEVARLIREDWKLRRSNYEKISTPLIDKLIAVAAKSGGRAAKVCGAGGGGCVIFMVKAGARERVVEALRMNGGQVLPSNLCAQGLVVSAARAAGA
jgi:D-glycero-alpha-D-manno-heptose-7-phosphate kinase